MTSRERVLCTLAHEEPDRVPLFIGTSGVTTLLGPAYERLKNHLGISDDLGGQEAPLISPPAAVTSFRPCTASSQTCHRKTF